MKKTKELKEKENFIMFPTVDFCFKELMQNENVRKGIIAALLNVSPDEIESTILIQTILRKEYEDDKYGILDVRVKLKNGTQIDFEMQVAAYEYWDKRSIFYLSKMYTDPIKEGEGYDTLKKCIHVSILNSVHFPEDDVCYRRIAFCDTETGKEYSDLMEMHMLELAKLPPEAQNEEGIILWMRFLGGRCEEDFRHMAEKDKYIEEAYDTLKKLSADEEKRLEYEARQKVIRDHNSFMKSAGEKRTAARNRERNTARNTVHFKGIGIEETKFECGADCRRTSNFIKRCENDFRRKVIPCMKPVGTEFLA